MYNLLLIALIGVLLLVSALLSGIETSLTSLGTSQINKHNLRSKLKGKFTSKNSLKQEKERIIATIILGNTVVNVFSSSLATALFVEYYGNKGLIIFTLLVTAVVIIFSEILPKTIALYYPEEFLIACYSKVRLLICALQPVTDCFQLVVNFILRVFNISRKQENVSAADSIRRLVALHRSNNNMNDQEVDILNSVLDLTEVEVSQIMVHRKNVLSLNEECGMSQVIETIQSSDCHHIPIWKGNPDNIVHVLDAKGLFKEYKKNPEIKTLDAFTYKPWFVPENTVLSVQLSNFREKNRDFALVVDEYGTFQGIVTISDILKEIMGEMNSTDYSHDIKAVGDDKFSMNAEMLIRDINRKLKWDLPANEASTLSGLIMNYAHKIPSQEETFQIDGFIFKIEQKSHKTIKRVIIGPAKQCSAAE